MVDTWARPAASAEEACSLASQLFQLQCQPSSCKQLVSYDDQNWYLCTDTDQEYVLKIYNASSMQAVQRLEAQACVMQHLRSQGIPCSTPVPCPPDCPAAVTAHIASCWLPMHLDSRQTAALTSNTRSPSATEGTAGQCQDQGLRRREHPLWLLHWLPGQVLGEMPQTPALQRAVGCFMGRVSKALSQLQESRLEVSHEWCLHEAYRTLSQNLPTACTILAPEQQVLLQHFMSDWGTAQTALEHLPRQLCHADANECNLLADPQTNEVVGLLDFGDMCVTWTASEVAIAVLYTMLLDSALQEAAPLPLNLPVEPTPQTGQAVTSMPAEAGTTSGAHTRSHNVDTSWEDVGSEKAKAIFAIGKRVLEGYMTVHQLSREELQLVPLLVRARLALSLVNGACAAQRDPGNAMYVLTTQPAAAALRTNNLQKAAPHGTYPAGRPSSPLTAGNYQGLPTGMQQGKRAVRKKVLVVGAGAAGSACAWSLARHPEQFEVHVWEALPVPGGVASSCTVQGGKVVLNDQVQGGAASYRHNLLLLEEHGFKPHPVAMRIAFGQGVNQWTNHSASQLTARLQPEIARFGRLLKWVKRLEALFVLIPINTLLRMFRFSDEFRYQMVFPLVALFFGTGNQTPHVASAIIARVFLDPKLRLFDYSPDRLLSSVPEMFAFPVLQDIFTTIAARSSYTLHCSRAVSKIVRGASPPGQGSVAATDDKGVTEYFNELVFACGAETALKVLDKPTWLERRLLRNVRYYTDYCITHTDQEYMKRLYDMRPEQRDNYFVRTYPTRPEKIEMSFNLSTYQPHLREAGLDVYQTYYLDANDKDELWTDQQVEPRTVLAKRWMRQFAHTWTHFASWVPWARFIQGKRHTLYAGSYTLVNTQEVAVMSGLAAAYRLGADYPFTFDALATDQFDNYLGIAHGVRRHRPTDKIAQAAADQAAHNAAVTAASKLAPDQAPVAPAEETTTHWFPAGYSS